LALAAPVLAAGYDDFTAGMTANLRGDYTRAEAAFTAALAAPDLVPAYKPAAYRGRASAYLALDKCSEALADVKAFVALREPDISVIRLRVWANLCLKNADAARKDLDDIAKGKLDWDDLWGFARLEWRYGLYEVAAATAGESYKLADKREDATAYVLLWQFLNQIRAGKFDAAAAKASLTELKSRGWPRPVFDLYLGKLTPQKLQEEASSFWKSKETEQRCEANFYTAEWHLGQSDTAAATPLLLDVAKNCPLEFIERYAAKSELKRLGVPVPEE
jgi:hypothetical protein